MFSNYKNQMKEDILEYARESKGHVNSLEEFRDNCWIEDSVTGNGSGSYFCNAYRAQEMIGDLLFSDELLELFQELGYDHIPLDKGAEYIDVCIRCFLLDEVLASVEDEVKEIIGAVD